MREPLSLYVHIPFCTAKCGYCDFNSYAGQDHLIPAYDQALDRELRLWARSFGSRPVPTVYFGGGTPSLTPLDELSRVAAVIRECFRLEADTEWSLEANPGTVNEAYLRGLRELGVNRLSFGVQSFDDAELKALERIHTADDVRREVAAARAAGFDNVNLDLIFGLPGQTLDAWRRNLEEALRLEPEHLSAYALTVEEGTALARDVARGRKPPPDPDLQADMYELTEELLASAGYEHYELSNWAKPGRRCRHNLVYWRNGEYLGVGAGAHSYVDGVRFANERLPSRYLAAVNETWEASQGGGPVTMRQVASVDREPAAMQMAETAILGLRLIEGVDLAAFAARFGQRFEDVYAAELPELFSYGLIERSDGHIRLTRRGRLLGNEVFQRLLPQMREVRDN